MATGSGFTKTPSTRKLRGYAFDPSLSSQLETAFINNIIYRVPWEKDLVNGPVGEYLEVIDYDPTTKSFYAPVDLNDPYILAQDGLDPSESNPQFHQQMVYAVAMTTIKNFEKALGRKVIWAQRQLKAPNNGMEEEYVRQLRIYPHAMREANAYYSPEKKALLFGYFNSSPVNNTIQMPESLVFTCLSSDIIAHEVTHAILDGMYHRYQEATNPDVLAFHEAFADIVALFQHFTFPDVLKSQIAKTRGNLESQNLLGQLAQQFGSAIGNYGSLRDAIGYTDPVTKEWKQTVPNGREYLTIFEPHQRGSILVSAIFEAFINIYKNRVKDLLRIATGGTGILPQGELHPDLVNRLASEASKAAGHVLNMCIRALDYCPPVDITFGDYLRAIITADADVIAEDNRDYRLAFIEAFRRRGVYPEHIKSLSVESLAHKTQTQENNTTKELFTIISEFLRDYRNEVMYETDRGKIYDVAKKYITGSDAAISGLHERIFAKFEDSAEFEKITGLIFNYDYQNHGIKTSTRFGNASPGPSFQVKNLRLVSRVGPDGMQMNQIVFSMTQRSGVIMKNEKVADHYIPVNQEDPPPGGFELYGGCTIIFDLDSLQLKYAISKPLLNIALLQQGRRVINTERAERQYRYQVSEGPMRLNEYNQYFSDGMAGYHHEPFAFLHHH